jgi:hypothetical protein
MTSAGAYHKHLFRREKRHLVLALMFSGLLGVALYCAVSEGSIYLDVPRGLTAKANPAAPTIGLSYFSSELILDNCVSALTADAREASAAEACQVLASAMVERSPTYSYAWAVLAWAAAHQGLFDVAREALARSELTGPNEGWVASLRRFLQARVLSRSEGGSPSR